MSAHDDVAALVAAVEVVVAREAPEGHHYAMTPKIGASWRAVREALARVKASQDGGAEHGEACPVCPPDEEGHPSCPPGTGTLDVLVRFTVTNARDEAQARGWVSDALALLPIGEGAAGAIDFDSWALLHEHQAAAPATAPAPSPLDACRAFVAALPWLEQSFPVESNDAVAFRDLRATMMRAAGLLS